MRLVRERSSPPLRVNAATLEAGSRALPVRLGDEPGREHHEECNMSVGMGIVRLGSEPRPFPLSDVRLPLTRFDLALCVLPIIAFLAIVSSV